MKNTLYQSFWRMHFYAALFITPLLISLTLSGIGFLFYTNVENQLYDKYFFGDSGKTEVQSIDDAVKLAEESYAGYKTNKIIELEEPYNTRLSMKNADGKEKYVFLDDHNQIIGGQDAGYTFANIMRNTHSSLFIGGTFVNYLVELAACWAIFLMLSGIYMTFRAKLLKKTKQTNKRQKSRKFHALVGTMITIPMLVIIFTGLPWSAFMGKYIYQASQDHPSFGTPLLQQQPPTSDVSEIPWATRQETPPTSDSGHAAHHGMGADMGYVANPNQLSVEKLQHEIDAMNISKPYAIIYPTSEDGVYTVAKSSNTGVTGLDVSPDDETTMYFDQYSGKFIDKVGYEDYGILAKWFTWGIPLHEGHLFGWPNKLINLLVCLAFLVVIVWGFRTWLLRKKQGILSAPPKISQKVSIPFIIFMILLGILMPLFGFSLIAVLLVEFVINLVSKNKKEVH
ncbi:MULTISPECIES: PepSY domain-containing protein [unclassified Lysinibacillus]|uniref:PepSY-associated TM helix domain-containing protein n=1 Tax=unclassified Lysinibacillus TaxID=2636778 RepID=UPI0020126136|nr:MULTISPECIES: PepSY domain-containing protein [unclassified Lysinibacillus]MCL1694460.1 PepSY domain-containing protein [Lysinibacillus sp. BPa_S21]MCL1699292.1 PepSY domain-containing protein [Lysinibacillus sp. Bpr_S20]